MKVTGHARNNTLEATTARRGEPGWRNEPAPGAKARRRKERAEARAAAERYARGERTDWAGALAAEVARRMRQDASPLLTSTPVDADRQLATMAAKALLDPGA